MINRFETGYDAIEAFLKKTIRRDEIARDDLSGFYQGQMDIERYLLEKTQGPIHDVLDNPLGEIGERERSIYSDLKHGYGDVYVFGDLLDADYYDPQLHALTHDLSLFSKGNGDSVVHDIFSMFHHLDYDLLARSKRYCSYLFGFFEARFKESGNKLDTIEQGLLNMSVDHFSDRTKL